MINIKLKSKESDKQIMVNFDFVESMEPDYYSILDGFDYVRKPSKGTRITKASGEMICVFETIEEIDNLIKNGK